MCIRAYDPLRSAFEPPRDPRGYYRAARGQPWSPSDGETHGATSGSPEEIPHLLDGHVQPSQRVAAPGSPAAPRRAYVTATEGASSPPRVGGLSHLDQITIRVADVATDLVLVLLRRRQELSTTGAPFGVHGLDVLDPDVEEAADPVGVAWRLQGDRGLVVGRASAPVDDDPAVGEPTLVGSPERATVPPSTSV